MLDLLFHSLAAILCAAGFAIGAVFICVVAFAILYGSVSWLMDRIDDYHD